MADDDLVPALVFTEGELKTITLGLGLFLDTIDPAVHPVSMLMDANAAATRILAHWGETLPELNIEGDPDDGMQQPRPPD